MLRNIIRVPLQILTIITVAIAIVAQWVASLAQLAYCKSAGITGDNYDRAADAVTSPFRWVKSKMGS